MNKAPTRPMWSEEGKDYALGYMCKIDFECELGGASKGNLVYPTIEDCKERRSCVESCGIVEVKVEATWIVQEGDI